MAKPDSWMAFYGDDFQADTNHCSAAERGAYMDLLWACWRRGNELPSAADQLMRLARCTLSEWKSVRESVMAFFTKTDAGWNHKRIGKELAEARDRYEKKSRAGSNGAAKRWHKPKQNDSTAIAEPLANECTTHNSHSPDGEKHPSDVLPKPRKRKSQIPPDWQPNAKDVAHATDRGLSQQTVGNLIEPFRDHHLAKQTLSADFSANWRTWIANHINFHGTGPWPRNDAGRSAGNVSRSASPTAARDSILTKAGIQRGNDHKVRTERPAWSAGNDSSTRGVGPIIDGDFRERSIGPSDGIESPDEAEPGHDSGLGNTVCGVSETAGGIPAGRGETCVGDTTEFLSVVARMDRVEGEIGTPHVSAPHDVGGDDGLDIPEFLRRTA